MAALAAPRSKTEESSPAKRRVYNGKGEGLPRFSFSCQRREQLKEEGSSGFDLALDKRLDELSDFVLLVAWKLTGFLENLSQLAGGALPAWLARLSPYQEVSCHAQGVSERGQLLGTQGHRLSFPVCNHALGCPQFFGKLELG